MDLLEEDNHSTPVGGENMYEITGFVQLRKMSNVLEDKKHEVTCFYPYTF